MASQSDVEPPSGIKGEGTLDQPYDGGNDPENPPQTPLQKPVESAESAESVESPSTAHQGSGLPESPPNAAQIEKIKESKAMEEAEQKGAVPSSATPKSTGLAADGGNFDAAGKGAGKEAGRLRSLDREVSPGTRDDGTHAVTSGDKGESYEPSKFNKLKGKFHIGGH